MAACGSLQHIFEKPLPENPTVFDSFSPWKHIKSMQSHLDHDDSSSFTEIFGELHFKENNHPESAASSSPLPISSASSLSSVLTELSPQAAEPDKKLDKGNNNNNNDNNNSPTTTNYFPTTQTRHYGHSDSFSSMNSESLSLCTEGLGFESFDDVEDLKTDNIENSSPDKWQYHHHHERRRSISITKYTQPEYLSGEPKRSRISGVEFPPPISCIGRSGKPWVCFKSYRNNGRFILKEVRIPTQEFLHACREDGRLKLQFIQSDDEIVEEDEDDVEDEENEKKEERENDEKGDDDEHEHEHEHDHDQNDEEEEEKDDDAEKNEISGD